jgi:hypothetical protein
VLYGTIVTVGVLALTTTPVFLYILWKESRRFKSTQNLTTAEQDRRWILFWWFACKCFFLILFDVGSIAVYVYGIGYISWFPLKVLNLRVNLLVYCFIDIRKILFPKKVKKKSKEKPVIPIPNIASAEIAPSPMSVDFLPPTDILPDTMIQKKLLSDAPAISSPTIGNSADILE